MFIYLTALSLTLALTFKFRDLERDLLKYIFLISLSHQYSAEVHS